GEVVIRDGLAARRAVKRELRTERRRFEKDIHVLTGRRRKTEAGVDAAVRERTCVRAEIAELLLSAFDRSGRALAVAGVGRHEEHDGRERESCGTDEGGAI